MDLKRAVPPFFEQYGSPAFPTPPPPLFLRMPASVASSKNEKKEDFFFSEVTLLAEIL